MTCVVRNRRPREIYDILKNKFITDDSIFIYFGFKATDFLCHLFLATMKWKSYSQRWYSSFALKFRTKFTIDGAGQVDVNM